MNRIRAVLIVTFLGVTACTESPQPTQATAKVAEVFEVGRDVIVRSLAIDVAKNALWVGTSTGVLEIDLSGNQLRNTFTREHGLANEYVFAIGVDSRGYKWFGTNAGGVSRYRDGEWKTLFPLHGLADYWVYSFAEQKSGAFWIGTWAGVNRVELDKLAFTTYVKELVNEWVYGIAVDRQDRVWFGTEGGVSMFDGRQWKSWTHKDGLGAPNVANLPHSKNTGLGTRSRHDLSTQVDGGESYNPNYVFCMHAAADGGIWAGTWGGGVSQFNGARWRNYTSSDGLAGNIVYSMTQDKNGVFWFGTNHGLSRYDGRTWQTYGRNEGLRGDDVYAIVIAPNGDVWAGTRGSVVRIAQQ